MPYALPITLLILIGVGLLLNPKMFSRVTLEECMNRVAQQPLTVADDLGAYKKGDPDSPDLRLFNDFISIFYKRTEACPRLVETIDFVVGGGRGGYWITFINEEIVTWNQSGGRIRPRTALSPSNIVLAHKILEAVRDVAMV